MKKIRLLLALLLIAVFALTACMGCVEHQDINNDGKCDVCFTAIENDPEGGDEGKEPAPANPIVFSIESDKAVVYSGTGVTVSVADGAVLGSYSAENVSLSALPSSDAVVAEVSGKTVSFHGTGTVKIKAAVGSTASTNEITVTVLPAINTVSSLVATALSPENAYLGVCHDIGLTAETAPYFKLVGEDGFVRINSDGTLEIIGIRGKNSILKVTALNDDAVYENFYTVSGSHLVLAIRESLYSSGKIASTSADISMEKLSELESLSMLSGYPINNARDYCGFKFLTSLKSLSLKGNPLSNLSFLKGLNSLESLDVSFASDLDLSDNGIAVINSLKALPALSFVSVNGSVAYLNRQVYDALFTMVANGEITLEVIEGVPVAAEGIDSFSETVFFSLEECKAHVNANGGIITPAGDWTHAIISLPAEDYNKAFMIDASNLSILELYGSKAGYANSTAIYSTGSLELNLYNFALRSPRQEWGRGVYINGDSDSVLKINARRGFNSIWGADWYPVSFPLPGEGIVCPKLEVYSENGATLSIGGGLGCIGDNGAWSNGPQQGGRGGDGADAIVCSEAWFYTYDLYIKGGDGGAGGKGCDGGGELWESVLGYFNGAKGGDGGNGGYALYCANFHTLDRETGRSFISECLFGGGGGMGGQGGGKKMAGSNGDPGDAGDPGKRYLGETSKPHGPIH